MTARKTKPSAKPRPTGVAAVDRALSIVAALEAAGEPISLAALARDTQLYKSTLLRLLISLETYGYAARLPDGRYELGPMAFRLGLAYERTHRLRDLMTPVMEDLVRQGTESASFHIRNDATTRLCILRVDSQHSTLDRIRAGDILPLDRGAAGRVLLAFGGEPGAKYEAVRSALWAVSHGERDPLCAGIACPVLAASGVLQGALSLSGPEERFTEASVERMGKLLLKAAAGVSRALGADPKFFDRAQPLPRKATRSRRESAGA